MSSLLWLSAAFVGLAMIASPAAADKIKHPTAVFSGLDKITGRIISFEVAIDETVQFGTLQLTPRVCYSRPATEAPRTDAFAEVDEIAPSNKLKHIFAGWMFADSPGLHGIEHPIYDIWLTGCKGDGPLIHEAPEVADTPPEAEEPDPNAIAPASPATPAGEPIKPVKRRPKPKPPPPPPPPADASAPLDLGNSGYSSMPTSGRGMRRVVPVDIAPIPPANIGQ